MIKRVKGKNVSNYSPVNIKKYKGQVPIIVRSSWERMFCQWADMNPNIIEWSSESIIIKYFDPVQKKLRRYYPDFLIKTKNKKGKIEKWLIEVKPYHETIPPKITKGKSKKTILQQEATYIRNQAKWKAASNYCTKMKWKFKILTENQLFNRSK